MSLFFFFFSCFTLSWIVCFYPLIAQTPDYCQLLSINFMCYITDSVNLVVNDSNLSCFHLFYGSCQGYLVWFIALSVFSFLLLISSFRVWFRDILIDTRCIFNNFASLKHPFLSEHAPVFTMLSSIILITSTTGYILNDVY